MVLFATMAIVMVYCIVAIIAMWKLFEKAGQPGWASIVPFYNFFVLTKISMGKYTLAIVYMVISFVYFLLYLAANIMGLQTSEGVILFSLASIVDLGLIAVNSIVYYFCGKAFGKSTAWNVLMIFFGGILVLPMGFSRNTTYVGPLGQPEDSYY